MKKYYIVSKTPIGIRHSVREMDEEEASVTRNILGEENIILFATEEEIPLVKQCLSSEETVPTETVPA